MLFNSTSILIYFYEFLVFIFLVGLFYFNSNFYNFNLYFNQYKLYLSKSFTFGKVFDGKEIVKVFLYAGIMMSRERYGKPKQTHTTNTYTFGVL